MKVRIFNPATEPPEKEYNLKLFMHKQRIVLALADGSGDKIESSGLVAIRQDMKLIRCINIDPSLGLPLNEEGHLTIDKEEDEDF